MKEQFSQQPERLALPHKVYEGEVLPPLPKPARVQETAQVEERLKVIRTELTQYIEQPAPPSRLVIVERQVAEPESVWEQIGMGIGEGVAAVRGIVADVAALRRLF